MAIKMYVELMTSVFLVGMVLSCPVTPPCSCRNQTNIYTLKLEYIADCSNLGLTEVPSFTGGEVDRLLLNGNKIIKLSSGSFVNIKPKAIDLSESTLQIIGTGSLMGLELCLNDLDLNTNQLVLPLPELGRLMNLKTLNLDYNPNMNKIPSKAFVGLKSLEKLVLSRSRIHQFEAGAFDGLPALSSLDFYGNYMSEVPPVLSGLKELTYLNFDSNQITNIPANTFVGLENLKELQLSRNSFSSPAMLDKDAFVGLDNLEKLGFYYDQLGSVPSHTFHPLQKLTQLDLSYNNLSRIVPGDLNGLPITYLDIGGNRLKFEPGMFKGIETTLDTILIRQNGLSALPVDALKEVKSLQWVDAASSSFPKDLPANFVSGLSIKRLGIMWMNLTSVDRNTFNGVNRPFHLDIFSNQIKYLDFVVDPCQFDYIDISQNPIHCDCHVYNLTQAHTTYLQGTCATPSAYKGLDFQGEEFAKLAKNDCKDYPITGPVKCPWH